MAFSLETKHDIIFLLGYPAKTIIADSNWYNSIIADRLEDVDSFTQDKVEELIKQIDDVRGILLALQNQGTLKQVGDIVFNVENSERSIKMEYKRLLKELSSYLAIPLKSLGGNIIGVCLWAF